MIQYLPSPRNTNILLAAGCAGLICVGLYFQYALGLEPCPLCMTQRVAIITTGVICALAAIHNRGLTIYASFALLTSIAGGAISSRQLWLQSLPEDQVPACGPSLEYMLDAFPLSETLKIMLSGDGNCAEVVWTFLGISIPGWTLVAFCGLAGAQLWQIFRPR